MKKVKGIIVCNKCGLQINLTNVILRDEVLAQDETREDIVERYFECPHCGEHYTVTVTDREVRLMMQRQQQIRRQVQREKGKGKNRTVTIEKLLKESEGLKRKILCRTRELKEKYLKEE